VRGSAPRLLRCPNCGFEAGRDVVAVLNLEKRYLTSKGPVPLAPMPNDPTPEVAVLPMKRWVRRKTLDEMNIKGQTGQNNGKNDAITMA